MKLRTEKAWIGEREFELSELTCANRSVIITLIGEAQLPGIVNKVMQAISPKKKEGASEDEAEVGDLFNVVLANSDMLTSVITAITDAMGGLTQIILLSIKGDLSEDDRIYIVENLTIGQEVEILNILLELNAIPELVKNFKSLLGKARKLKGL
jgi:hypothetical protein